jgi:hypothetical protein
MADPRSAAPGLQFHLDLTQGGSTYTDLTSLHTGGPMAGVLEQAPAGVLLAPWIEAPATPAEAPQASTLVDGWLNYQSANFAAEPLTPAECLAFDARSTGATTFWGVDDTRSSDGQNTNAFWPARAGAAPADPDGGTLPANLDSYFKCGLYNMGLARSILIEFDVWQDIRPSDGDDYLFIGLTTGPEQTASGLRLPASADGGWRRVRLYADLAAGTQFSVVFRYVSDAGLNTGRGAWIDGLRFWRYTAPDSCQTNNPSAKGVVVPPYEGFEGRWIPFVRAGETRAFEHLQQAGAGWVRLNFIDPAGQLGQLDLQEYDRMVDTFCANGISVLGLVGHEAIPQVPLGWINDPARANEYALRLATVTGVLARHYRGRITHWEVFNEPNLGGAAYVNPDRYGFMLAVTYNEIMAADGANRVMFGGLGSANKDSRDYARRVFEYWDNNLNQVRPFAIFAVHPYAPPNSNPNPAYYFYDPNQIDRPGTNLMTKFRELLQAYGMGSVPIWATEVGWNAAIGDPAGPSPCIPYPVTVYQQSTHLMTLFNQLLDPAQGGISKVIWYQYNDVPVVCNPALALASTQQGAGRGVTQTLPSDLDTLDLTAQGQIIPWNFGLYDITRNRPKFAECAFRNYPVPCPLNVSYLPIIGR